MSLIEIKQVCAADLQRIANLECEAYPADEGASLEQLQYRHSVAPELFLGYYKDGILLAYICGTRSSEARLTVNSMKIHDDKGYLVCIHSVCVDKDQRRKGIALSLLKMYVEYINTHCLGVRKIALISHSELIPLYTRAGFTLLGPSPVKHGKRRWYECELSLRR